MLDIITPSFEYNADFRLPGTLLLLMNMRRPLLAGVSKVVPQPTQHLLSAAGKPTQGRVWACLNGLSALSCQEPDKFVRRKTDTPRAVQGIWNILGLTAIRRLRFQLFLSSAAAQR